jgi:hypothetical protein
MTMDFKRPPGLPLAGARVGSEVTFEFRRTPAGEFELTAVAPKGTAK